MPSSLGARRNLPSHTGSETALMSAGRSLQRGATGVPWSAVLRRPCPTREPAGAVGCCGNETTPLSGMAEAPRAVFRWRCPYAGSAWPAGYRRPWHPRPTPLRRTYIRGVCVEVLSADSQGTTPSNGVGIANGSIRPRRFPAVLAPVVAVGLRISVRVCLQATRLHGTAHRCPAKYLTNCFLCVVLKDRIDGQECAISLGISGFGPARRSLTSGRTVVVRPRSLTNDLEMCRRREPELRPK